VTNEFTKEDIGKKVYCLRNGWGIIIAFADKVKYPVIVRFTRDGEGCTEVYTVGGHYLAGDVNSSIFWGEVKIIPPPKPKQKTKKEITLYQYTYKGRSEVIYQTHWSTEPFRLFHYALLNTETKTVIIEVEE